MTNRLEINWKLDGDIDEQRYYCSETQFTGESIPNPKATISSEVRSYIDYDISANKAYYTAIGSVRGGIEKLSDIKKILTIPQSTIKLDSKFAINLNDSVGNTWSTFGGATITNGALRLDGVNSYLVTASNQYISLSGNTDLSFSFKIKYLGQNASSNTSQYVFSKRFYDNAYGRVTGFVFLLNTSTLGFGFTGWGEAGNPVFSKASITLSLGVEASISYERKDMQWYVYLNGNLIDTFAQSAVLAESIHPFAIGCYADPSSSVKSYFNGSIRDVFLTYGIAFGGGGSTTISM